MNVLVFDAPGGIARLVQSLLRSQGHRISVSSDSEDATRKISTDLFDAVVIGPAGDPRKLAEWLVRDFAQLPIVLAGAPAALVSAGRIAASLEAPLSARRLLSTFHALEGRRRSRLEKLPAQFASDGVSIACRLADLTPERMVLAGESEQFHRWTAGAPRHVEALIRGTALAGEVDAVENDFPNRIHRVGVRLEGDRARFLLAELLKA